MILSSLQTSRGGPRQRSSDRLHTVCLRFPDAPPQSEVFGEFPHFCAPHRLLPGPGGVPEVTLTLRPGVYSYKLRTPDGSWHLHASNPRTRSSDGYRNSVLVVGGTPEPVLHVPALPFVFVRSDGLVTIRAALRKTAGERLSLRLPSPHGLPLLPMQRMGEEDEHWLFEAHVPSSGLPLDYWFCLPSGELIGGPFSESLQTALPPSEVPPWWPDAVLYSIFVDRFRRGDGKPWPPLADEKARAGGDLDGVRAALPYLSDLGVTVLHLTPIWQSPSAHRYDAENPLVVDPALGGEAALRHLVTCAEQLGIRILLDVTLTHVHRSFLPFCDVRLRGPGSPYASFFRFHRWPFSDGPSPGYEHYQYGQWCEPLLNTESPEIATYLLRVLLHYLSLGVAGFRLDSAADVPQSLLSLLRDGVRAVRKDALLLGELTVDNLGHYIGHGLDCATDFSLQTGLLRWLHGELNAQQLSSLRALRLFGLGPSSAAIGLTTTHDQPRLRTLVDERRAKLGHVFSLLGPQVPMIYYGDELGLHSAEPSRRFEDVWPDRQPFPWAGGASEASTLSLFRSLLALRHQHAVFRQGECLSLSVAGAAEVLAFRRQLGDEVVDVFLNATAPVADVPLPDGPSVCDVLFSIGDVSVDEKKQQLSLGAFSALVLSRRITDEVQQLSRVLIAEAESRGREAFRLGLTSGLLLPSKLYLTVTERCNLRCQHCITHAPERTLSKTARTMQPWLFDALDEAFAAASYFGFSHGGESLVSPHFLTLLKRIRQAKKGTPYDAHLLSNGMLLRPDVVEQLVELGVTSLAVSLDGGTQATNDEIRQGCDFDRVVHNLRHAVALRRQKQVDVRIGVSTVVLRQNVEELPQLAQLVCDLGLDWLKIEEGYPVNVYSAESLLRPDSRRVAAALEKVRTIVEPSGVILVDHLAPPGGCPCQARPGDALSEFRVTDDFANRAVFRPCQAAWEIACIDPDGVVHAGDYSSPPLGSLADASLFQLWNGPIAQASRRDALGLIDPRLRSGCSC